MNRTQGPMSPSPPWLKEALEVRNSLQVPYLTREIEWLHYYDEALERAFKTFGERTTGAQLVLAFFTGSDWCSYCKAITQEVFETTKFRAWFNRRRMVPLLLDYPHTLDQPDDIKTQNAALYTQYAIEGFPTIVAIGAYSGYCTQNEHCVVSPTEVGRFTGYTVGSGVDAWITGFSAVTHIL